MILAPSFPNRNRGNPWPIGCEEGNLPVWDILGNHRPGDQPGFGRSCWAGVDRHRESQPLVSQVELIHHLVVVVSWRRILVPREGGCVRPLEEQDSAVFSVEHGMMLGVVKAVVIMCDDLACVDPGT